MGQKKIANERVFIGYFYDGGMLVLLFEEFECLVGECGADVEEVYA